MGWGRGSGVRLDLKGHGGHKSLQRFWTTKNKHEKNVVSLVLANDCPVLGLLSVFSWVLHPEILLLWQTYFGARKHRYTVLVLAC